MGRWPLLWKGTGLWPGPLLVGGSFFGPREGCESVQGVKIRAQLISYCNLDTLAMVKVWKKF